MTAIARARTDSLTWQEVGDEIVILDLSSSRYLSLNGTGALLWKALVGGAKVVDLADQLSRDFEISEKQADEDVTAFLADCTRLGLLE